MSKKKGSVILPVYFISLATDGIPVRNIYGMREICDEALTTVSCTSIACYSLSHFMGGNSHTLANNQLNKFIPRLVNHIQFTYSPTGMQDSHMILLLHYQRRKTQKP